VTEHLGISEALKNDERLALEALRRGLARIPSVSYDGFDPESFSRFVVNARRRLQQDLIKNAGYSPDDFVHLVDGTPLQPEA